MYLFKSQLLQEPARHVAGPYRRGAHYARRKTRPAFDPGTAVAGNDDGDACEPSVRAEREILRRMADYDIAA